MDNFPLFEMLETRKNLNFYYSLNLVDFERDIFSDSFFP